MLLAFISWDSPGLDGYLQLPRRLLAALLLESWFLRIKYYKLLHGSLVSELQAVQPGLVS